MFFSKHRPGPRPAGSFVGELLHTIRGDVWSASSLVAQAWARNPAGQRAARPESGRAASTSAEHTQIGPMELTSTPHRTAPRRRRRIALGVAVVSLLALTALVLAPLALGLHHVVIRDGAMGPSWRGSVAIEELKPGRDLGVGNVITFVPPTEQGEPAARTPVTRRVDSKRGGLARTRADGGALDPWQLELDEASYSRVIVRAPYVGRVLLGQGPLVLAASLGALVVASIVWRRRPRRSDRAPARVAEPSDVV